MNKKLAWEALDSMKQHLAEQKDVIEKMENILDPKTPDNMNNIIIKRIVNNIGNKVMVIYEENKVSFEVTGILQRPETPAKFFGIKNHSTAQLDQAKNSSVVVFHPDNVSEVLETPIEKYRIKINLDPFKS